MIVVMRPDIRTDDMEVNAVESAIRQLGHKPARLPGDNQIVIAAYGQVTEADRTTMKTMAGVEQVVPIGRRYKRAAQKGSPDKPIYTPVKIGNVICGNGELVRIAGPCSVESERQIMKAAEMVRDAGGHVLRGGVRKYRSDPSASWHGIGTGSDDALRYGLSLIVRAGREYGLPTVVEILDTAEIPIYEDAGIDCLQVGEPNSRNTALLDALARTSLPILHKRANSAETEGYLLWAERSMMQGKTNIILCERGVMGPMAYTRNILDLGSVAAWRYHLSCLPIAVDASHGTGNRDLVFPMTLAGIMAGASVVLVEAHPNPLLAKSDGHQSLFPEQLKALFTACHETWKLRQTTADLYQASASLEKIYERRLEQDRTELFG